MKKGVKIHVKYKQVEKINKNTINDEKRETFLI